MSAIYALLYLWLSYTFVLPVFKFYINGVIYYVVFIWFLSQNIDNNLFMFPNSQTCGYFILIVLQISIMWIH